MERWNNSMLLTIEGSYSQKEGPITVKSGAEIRFAPGTAYVTLSEGKERFVLSNLEGLECLSGENHGWILGDKDAVELRTEGKLTLRSGEQGITANAEQACTLIRHPVRPRADLDGNRYQFSFPNGEEFEETLARFYWDTMVPSIVERTRAAVYSNSDGYVVSTLQPGAYAGTYPDVDHEFQCKGRLAYGDSFDQGVVRRMMELQLRMMREDPIGLWRNPCAIQPDGTREYHVRRNSYDGSANAEMFLVTGNVEILETAWLYVTRTGDINWLARQIDGLEGAASLLEHLTDESGRLWSDVFYEDQVIKDGMECMSAAMAANGFRCLALLEEKLSRTGQAAKYREMERKIAAAMVLPAPQGFWDTENSRFIDWLDRNGDQHDHVHLLSNILPVLMGYTTKEQGEAVKNLVAAYLSEFQRFPTFLSAFVQDYTNGEIGDGGPYDLCAAGRYWCWDAAYWSFQRDRSRLEQQLLQVSGQAKLDQYRMGERYDMNHVYYQDDKNWHGAARYYEYPCVFSWVLLREYLGFDFEQDGLKLSPRLVSFGSVSMESFGVSYEYGKEQFALENLSSEVKRISLDLSCLYPESKVLPAEVTLQPRERIQIEVGER